MNKKHQKAIAEARGRKVYYLTDEEAAVIDKMRIEAQWVKQDAAGRPAPKCQYVHHGRTTLVNRGCVCKAKRDGYCLNHWNMIARRQRLGELSSIPRLIPD